MQNELTKISLSLIDYKEKDKIDYLGGVLQIANHDEQMKISTHETHKKFLDDCRNFLSHSDHEEKKVKEQYKTLLLEICKGGNFQTEDLSKYFGINIPNFVTGYFRKLKNKLEKETQTSPDLCFIIIILATNIPKFYISILSNHFHFDQHASKKEWQSFLGNLSQKNSYYKGVDLTNFLKSPIGVSDNTVADWRPNFIETAWNLLFETKDDKQKFNGKTISNKQIHKKLDAVRFECDGEIHEVSRSVLQQILYKKHTAINDLSSILEELRDRIPKKRNTPKGDINTLYSYYCMWEYKKQWVYENSSVYNLHYAVRSFTRYLLRSYSKLFVSKNDTQKYQKRELYLELYHTISSSISKQLKKKQVNISQDLKDHISLCQEPNFNEFLAIVEAQEVELNCQNNCFSEVYIAFCDARLKEFGTYQDIFDKWRDEGKSPSIKSNQSKEQQNNNDSVELILKTFSKKSHRLPYTSKEVKIHRKDLLYKGKYLTEEGLDIIISKLKKLEFIPHQKELIKELRKFKQTLPTENNKGKQKTPNEKREYKENIKRRKKRRKIAIQFLRRYCFI